MENYNELSKEQLDALQEVGNIGVGNAASALADLIGAKIDINIPKLGVVPFNDAFSLIGESEDLVIGLQLNLTGDTSGVVLFLFDEKCGISLCKRLLKVSLGVEKEDEDFDEISQSAIQEIGNILTGSFISALSQITSLNFKTSPPALAYDMLGAIVSTSLVVSQQFDNQVLIFETQLFLEEDAIKGHFLFLPSPETLPLILKGLGL